MKKIYGLFFTMLMFIGLGVVNASTLANDSNNNIDFPSVFNSDSKVTITGISSYDLSYQIQKVDNDTTLSTAIDNYYKTNLELEKITDQTSEEYLTKKSELNNYLTEINNNIKDYDDTAWKTSTNDSIYNSTDVTNTTDGKYIVWVKLVNKTNNSTIYDNNFYSFKEYGSTTNNPETGIETTALYVGVIALVLVGSSLVFRKNKEMYN